MSEYPYYQAFPSAPPLQKTVAPPPRLHWGWVLGLNIVTRGLFGVVWLLVQANWVRRTRGKSTAFVWSIIHAVFFPSVFVLALIGGVIIAVTGGTADGSNPIFAGLMIFVFLGIATSYLFTVFTLMKELEEEPIGISLSGAMTFFFGVVYFQYHLRDYMGPEPIVSGTLNLSGPVAQLASDPLPPTQDSI